jgi:chromate transporter
MTRKRDVSRTALFLAFLEIGLSGFGGVLPWARLVLVERRRWLSDREFVETLSLGQALPGPNIINASIVIGARFHGALGAAIALGGLLLAPLVIVLLLALLYDAYHHLDTIRRIFSGVAAAAAGLVLATGIKMALQLPRAWKTLAIAGMAFVCVGLLRLPLFWVLLALAPLSIAIAWSARR